MTLAWRNLTLEEKNGPYEHQVIELQEHQYVQENVLQTFARVIWRITSISAYEDKWH
jgi:hypothetical protein